MKRDQAIFDLIEEEKQLFWFTAAYSIRIYRSVTPDKYLPLKLDLIFLYKLGGKCQGRGSTCDLL